MVDHTRTLFIAGGTLFILVQLYVFSGLQADLKQDIKEADGDWKCLDQVNSLIQLNHALQARIAVLEAAQKAGATIPAPPAEFNLANIPVYTPAPTFQEVVVQSHTISPLPAAKPPPGQRPGQKFPAIPDSPSTGMSEGCKLPADSLGGPHVAAVVVMTFNRASYLQRTLNSINSTLSAKHRKLFPIFVSEDGIDGSVRTVAEVRPEVHFMRHQQHEEVQLEKAGEKVAYYRIAKHYKWVLQQLFDECGYQRVVILEDDMEVAPDIWSYFAATAPLLDRDPSLVCVSSWNDNGQEPFVKNPKKLYRSDFFPGLGWMLKKDTWNELRDIWPHGYWDDWMRLRHVRQGRQCIRPEVCRTYNFGEQGTSGGQFYKEFLRTVRINHEPQDFEAMELQYLEKERYERLFGSWLANATQVKNNMAQSKVKGDSKVPYTSQKEFEMHAKSFGIFTEWKDGVPRGAYKGVVTFRAGPNKARVFLYPDKPLIVSPTGEMN